MAADPRNPSSKGFHAHETVHIRSKPENEGKTNIVSVGEGQNIDIHINPKGEGRIIFDKRGQFIDITVTGSISGQGPMVQDGYALFKDSVEVEDTIYVDTINERIEGCNEGITIEGVRIKNGKIFSEEIETIDWTAQTTSTEQSTTNRIITYNSGEPGPGMTDTDRMSGFRVDRGISGANTQDYMTVYDEDRKGLVVGFYHGDDAFAFDRDCVDAHIVHASKTITDKQIPFAQTGNISGSYYEESPTFTFDWQSGSVLNVDGDITISGCSVATLKYVNQKDDEIYTTMNYVSGAIQLRIDNEVDDLYTNMNFVSGAIQTRIDNEVDMLNTTINTVSGAIQLRIDNEVDDLYTNMNYVSGAIQTRIDNEVDLLNTTITTVSGTLDYRITNEVNILNNTIFNVSGALDYKIDSEVTLLNDTITTVSGGLQEQIDALNGEYATDISLANVSGNLESQIATVSGSLQSQIIKNVKDATTGIGTGVILGDPVNDASGNFAIAEGFNTNATSEGAHAEGRYTFASGIGSHAEGQNTLASGQQAHAEGQSTTASGDFSHAGGNSAKAIHDFSFVWSDGADFDSLGEKTFNIHAENGVWISGGNLNVSEAILPTISGGIDIGSIDLPFRDLYLLNNSIYLGSDVLSVENGKVKLNGETASVTQENLNALESLVVITGSQQALIDTNIDSINANETAITEAEADVTAISGQLIDKLNKAEIGSLTDPVATTQNISGSNVHGTFYGDASKLDFSGLPTSDPMILGRMWSDGGVLKISAG